MKTKILIYGAGAIGRGYIPWIFPNENYELSFVENDPKIRNLMLQQKKYTTYRTKNNKYEELVCRFKDCSNIFKIFY